MLHIETDTRRPVDGCRRRFRLCPPVAVKTRSTTVTFKRQTSTLTNQSWSRHDCWILLDSSTSKHFGLAAWSCKELQVLGEPLQLPEDLGPRDALLEPAWSQAHEAGETGDPCTIVPATALPDPDRLSAMLQGIVHCRALNHVPFCQEAHEVHRSPAFDP